MADIEPAGLGVGAPADGAVATDEMDRLIASDKVAGTEVYDRAGERIGSVYNFMVDKVTGQVAYVVMSFGGFLGLGERLRPLPWTALTYVPAKRGYMVDLDRDASAAAASPDGPGPVDAEQRRTVSRVPESDIGL